MPGQPIPYHQWGANLDANALQQMENACKLPVSVAAALMPDAHVGYGLPIGGVLATDNAVIPYAVGVDIACRVKLTVLDLPLDYLRRHETDLIRAIEAETRFGVGVEFKHRRMHPVMDEDWSVSPVTQRFRDKAAAQLGTSGSGNHFVEFGEFTIENKELGLEPGTYLALLSHSGSRGTGAPCATTTAALRARNTRICQRNSAISRGSTLIPPTARNTGRRWN
jgi:tRNA-splicing ligase RtcB